MADGAATSDTAPPRLVDVTFERLGGWIERYDSRHPDTAWQWEPDRVAALSPDGASASFVVPFSALKQLDRDGLLRHLERPWRLGVLLVRKGGFAVAYVDGDAVAESKVGRRHVQGRSKAGGWSQQRFARRRDNQAREAYEAAAGHAARLLLPVRSRLDALVVGGDRSGVQAVLVDRRLAAIGQLHQVWVDVAGDPRRPVLDAAVTQARSVEVRVVDPLPT